MYQFNKTPGIWQHPTPQQTFPDVQSTKATKPPGYLRDRLRSAPPEQDDAASTSQSETLDVGAAFFNQLAKSTHKPSVQLKMAPGQHRTPQTSSSGSNTGDLSILDKLRHEYSMIAADVHEATVSRLREVQSDLETAVMDAAKQDADFLASVSAQMNLTRSLNAESAKYELTDEETGRKTVTIGRIDDHIKSSTERLKALDAEVHRLWDQWEDTQNEISAILQEVTKQGSNSRHGHNGRDAEFSTLAATIRTEFKNDMKALEKEWASIKRDAMANSKAAEQEAKNSAARVIAGLVQRTIF